MRCECGENVWLGKSQKWEDRTEVYVEADIVNGRASLLSVKPWNANECKVGETVKYGDCIISQLSQEQIEELEEAMLDHAED